MARRRKRFRRPAGAISLLEACRSAGPAARTRRHRSLSEGFHMRAILAALVLLAAACFPASAEESRYLCEVEGFYRFVEAQFRADDRSELIGERFSVERASGTISGFELSNEEAEQKTVLDRGSDKQAFKVLSVFEVYGPYQAVKYLYVEEFAPTPEKPFFAVSGSWLLTGHCS
jgi:hypothetical protein